MINKSIKYIGVILLAYTLNACNEQRMNSSSETTTPVWLAEPRQEQPKRPKRWK